MVASLSAKRAAPPLASRRTASGPSLLGALIIAARQRGIHLSVEQLTREHLLEPGMPSLPQLLQIAEASGLRATLTRLDWQSLPILGKVLPAIVLLQNGSAMVLRQIDLGSRVPCVVLQDPNAREDVPLVLDEARFTAAWTGEVILLKRDYRIGDEDQPFGIKLILGQLLRDRWIARDVGIAAVSLSLLAIAPIMFWRLLIDRVLYYGSLDTFAVICVSMAVVFAFETGFGYLRRYLVLHITQRADAKISTYMFDKVLSLPVDFFERNPVGEITRDMGEVQKIRNFLTGQLFGSILDAFVLFVFLPVMFFFSPLLTIFVLIFCALICGWIMLRLPGLRAKSTQAFRAEGQKGAFLVETLHGVRTVKALALDSRRRHEWDVKVAHAARLRFDEGRGADRDVEAARLWYRRAAEQNFTPATVRLTRLPRADLLV